MIAYLARSFSSLRNRNYRVYAAGQVVSVSGTWMQKVTQALLVLQLTNSAVMLGVATALQEIPVLLLAVWGGSLADRFSKRKVLLITQALSTIPAVLLGLLCATGTATIGVVLVLAAVLGVIDAAERPARHTLVNDLVEPHDLTNAVMLNTVIQNSGKVVGPALAGVLIASQGLAIAFFLNAASFVAVIVGLSIIRPRTEVRRSHSGVSQRRQFIETIQYVRSRPDLLGTLIMVSVSGLLAYNWTVLLPLLAQHAFDGGAAEVGLTFASQGLGAVIGGVALAGLLQPRKRTLRRYAFAFSGAMLSVAIAPTLGVAYALIFLLGASSVAYRTAANAILQLRSEPHMRGRVIGLYIIATGGTSPLGAPLVGWICEVLGVRWAFVIAGVATAAATVIATRIMSDARNSARSAPSAA